MNINEAFGIALRKARKRKHTTQEDFALVSSRTYISSLERGLKSITIEKLEEISAVIGIHPLALLCHAYLLKDGEVDVTTLIELIQSEEKLLGYQPFK